MAPTRNKHVSGIENGIPANLGVSTRSKNGVIGLKTTLKQAVKNVAKRKAGSPLRETTVKRAAFGDITNAITNGAIIDKEKTNLLVKKVTVNEKQLPTVKIIKKKQANVPAVSKRVLRKTRSDKTETKQLSDHLMDCKNDNSTKPEKHLNEESHLPPKKSKDNEKINEDLSEESLYVSATEDINESKQSNANSRKSGKESSLSRDINLLAINDKESPIKLPKNVYDFDKENWDDPFQVSHYAMDIFNYLKSREASFALEDYLPKQKQLTTWMRALLIDWMVEVQESFELNHETLYLAVKLVDLYLCKELTLKDELQLLGAAALFIASKFDERIPPLIDDFLYICDGAYTLRQLLNMEINVLKTIGFDLGIPLSYRFLRRYARCAKVSMPTLTLARYILELCLMEYSLIPFSDSLMAAAALYLALRMKNIGTWTEVHEYYTGYTVKDVRSIAILQNLCLHKKPREALSTVRNKYSHRIFFEVAKVPLLSLEEIS